MALTEKLTAIADAIRVQSGKTDKIALGDMPTEILNLQSLNFEVVRYASEADLPETAKENTLAVFTDVDIDGWHFRATQPNEMKQGEVWFLTTGSSSAPFNALKDNCIEVYPVSVKQYVDNALVNVGASIYQNGKWVDLNTGKLYDRGNQFESVTGGWDTVTLANAQCTFTEDSISFKVKSTTATTALAFTHNKVDVSEYSKLVVTGDITNIVNTATDTLMFGVTNATISTDPGISWIASKTITTRGAFEAELDISGVSGSAHIGVRTHHAEAEVYTVTLKK